MALRILERGTIDGLIVAGTNHGNFIEALRQVGIPFVVFANNVTKNTVLEELHSVGFDSEDGTRQATEFLINLHHRHIWCIADPNIPWYARCYRGYAKSMAKAELHAQLVDVPQKELPYQYGKKCAAWLLESKKAATAIVAGDDEIALGVLAMLREKGMQVPGDLSVVGFDDLEELKYFHPGLTTVRVDRERVGEELAKVLFELLERPNMSPVKRMVPTQLVVRETCASPHHVAAQPAT
jgi:DNA-binding LacI/PurR family transcriptional regulator